MNNHNLSSQLNRLNFLFDQSTSLSEMSIELQAHWARYLCVLCAGYMEVGLAELYGHYINSSASRQVAMFARNSLRSGRNTNTDRLLKTAGAFDKRWREELQLFLGDEGRGDAVNSIISNRNLIAHGGNSGITVVRLREWFDKSVEVLEFIEQQCNPTTRGSD